MQVLGVGIMYIMLGCTLYVLPKYIDINTSKGSLLIGKALLGGGILTTVASFLNIVGLIPDTAAFITMSCCAIAASLAALKVSKSIGKESSS